MNELSPRNSARILQFRPRPSFGSPSRARPAEVTRLRAPTPVVVDADAWYHAAAVDEARKR